MQRNVFHFGPYSLDAAAKVLLKDGAPVSAPRKTVETLLALVVNSGQVLTKEELMQTVWPDRVVDDANLTQHIAVIRRTLGVQRGDPGFIETFPGRGYRILGPVTVADDPAAPPPPTVSAPSAPARPWRLALLGLAAAVFLAAMSALLWRRADPKGADQARRIPVTRLDGREVQPVLSPSGAGVAFVWNQEQGGTSEIWVQRPGSDSPQRVSS